MRGTDDPDNPFSGIVDSQQYRTICLQLAQSLVRIPQIQNAANPPKVVLTKVTNKSNEIFDVDSVPHKIRKELVKNCGGKITFLDREQLEQVIQERQAKENGTVTSSGNAPMLGADFFLTGRVEGIDTGSGRNLTRYIRFSLRLTDAATTAIVWEDDYELKKYRVEGTYDR
jgi:PBP1b-binding outer membrane lipoprotein LpoB